MYFDQIIKAHQKSKKKSKKVPIKNGKKAYEEASRLIEVAKLETELF